VKTKSDAEKLDAILEKVGELIDELKDLSVESQSELVGKDSKRLAERLQGALRGVFQSRDTHIPNDRPKTPGRPRK
jgi:hypothetical protein